MKIVHLVAGAGGMYCGSCLQGNTLCRALREAGHDVVLVPVYTPLRTDEENVSIDRVVFGGPNVFLQQRSALLRHVPRFVDRLLDHPKLLGRLGGSTRPERLGPLAVSMLRGEDGNQRKELEKLVAWLAEEVQPDLIHLSTALLVGVARTLTERLDVPVVCTLSGEDGFVEKLREPHRAEAREELRSRCGELAALIAPSGYYAEFMADYLGLPTERITVIRPGLNLEGHGEPARPVATESEPEQPEEETHDEQMPDEPIEAATFEDERSDGPLDEQTSEELAPDDEVDIVIPEQKPAAAEKKPIMIGYLSRICPAKGLHQLVEAFRLLLRNPALPPIRLVAAGYLGSGDRAYFRQIRRQIDHRGLVDWFEYAGQLDRAEKIAFLQSLDVLSIPTTRPESKGLAVLEGWANGTPAVLPEHGVFSELVAETGGGLLYEPNRPTALAAALETLIQNPKRATRQGQDAREVVHREYDIRRTARQTVELYRTL